MGFPNWTLYGMGASALAALLAVGLAYLAQSPATLRRLGLDSFRLDKRIRGLTGWGLAFILLAIGFFAAGVPLDGAEPAAAPEDVAAVDGMTPDAAAAPESGDGAAALPGAATPTLPQVSSGAMGSQPPEDTPEDTGSAEGATPTSPVRTATGEPEDVVPEEEEGASDEPEEATATPSPTPSPAPTVTPSPTATPRPTQTPTPTVSPTPLSGETAVISTGGSTLWVRRSPGGQELALVRDGDVVLLHAGRANQAGILWREVSTLDGIRGWVQDEFLE